MQYSAPILLGCRKRTRPNGAMYVNAVWKPTTHTTRWSKHLTTITAPWVDDDKSPFSFDIGSATTVRGQHPITKKAKKAESFGVQQYLSNAGVSRRIAKFKKRQVIFSQDDPCDDVLYIQSGNAKLTIVNPQGKEAVLAIVGPGDFLGEGCIIGNRYA